MQRELVLESGKSVVEGMVKAFEAMIEEARAQAKAAVESPATAVHDYRRAARRAESVVLLAWPLMRKAQRGWIREAVARARRRTRVLRDLDAVMPVLGKLQELELDEEGGALAALKAWLEEARGDVATGELVAWRLRKNVRSLAGLSEMFAVGLHAWADTDLIIESLKESYRFARKAWQRAEKTRRLDDIHAWRRAVRTLRYQLELLASRPDLEAAEALGAAHKTFKGMVKELGDVTDLIALRHIIEDAREHVVGVDWKRLLRNVDEVIGARTERLFEDARVAFLVRPRDFVVPVVEEEVPLEETAPAEFGEASPEAPGEASPETAPAEAGEASPEAAPAEAPAAVGDTCGMSSRLGMGATALVGLGVSGVSMGGCSGLASVELGYQQPYEEELAPGHRGVAFDLHFGAGAGDVPAGVNLALRTKHGGDMGQWAISLGAYAFTPPEVIGAFGRGDCGAPIRELERQLRLRDGQPLGAGGRLHLPRGGGARRPLQSQAPGWARLLDRRLDGL